jgi:toxin secretion/phage lysis holin
METLFYEILAVLVFTGLDYITGVINAVMHGKLSSTKMREGLGHKFAYLCTFFVAWFIDFEMEHIDIGFHTALTSLVTTGIVLIELSSIIENIGKINPELKNAPFMRIFSQSTNDKHKAE